MLTERESLLVSAALQLYRYCLLEGQYFPSHVLSIEREAGGVPTPAELLALCMKVTSNATR